MAGKKRPRADSARLEEEEKQQDAQAVSATNKQRIKRSRKSKKTITAAAIPASHTNSTSETIDTSKPDDTRSQIATSKKPTESRNQNATSHKSPQETTSVAPGLLESSKARKQEAHVEFVHQNRLQPYFDAANKLPALANSDVVAKLGPNKGGFKRLAKSGLKPRSAAATTFAARCQRGPYKGTGVLDVTGTGESDLVVWVQLGAQGEEGVALQANAIGAADTKIKFADAVKYDAADCAWLRFELHSGTIHEFAIQDSDVLRARYSLLSVKTKHGEHIKRTRE